uniref:Pyrroline-5-carboxylate reductase n=1 Tax=Magnetococcus massalia (strain MO-1) TaxID=451514 RepID=A0A1S7LPA7_MAGMO|nr:Pyrroline-5-carboxylate reductase [Candidatus Magnetococcus massalia]
MASQHEKIAFLGGGNMARAIIQGLCQEGYPGKTIQVSEPFAERRTALQESFAVKVFEENSAAVRKADLVVVAVKPNMVLNVLEEVAEHLKPDTVVLSIAAGMDLAAMESALNPDQPLIRAMPNTPALVGEGMTVLAPIRGTSDQAVALAEKVMGAVGQVAVVQNEALMDGVTALSGSGPAYFFLMAEALSDGGVAAGLPRDLADRLAVQTMMGSAALLKESGQHPGVLKNQVTSPGGTTIAGIGALEQGGFRGTLMAAVDAACKRSKALSNQ